MVALDPSLDAIARCRELGAQLLLAHHPLLFSASRRLDLASGVGRRVAAAIRAEVNVIAAHTDWDLASPGLNDALAAKLELRNVDVFGSARPSPLLRLVTYVPPEGADELLDALAAAGAGEIGRYRRCAFRNRGEGTFEPMPGAHPAVGEVGRREVTEEIRLETVLPADRRNAVLAALRAHHPYEEAAFGFVAVDGDRRVHVGRIGETPRRSLEETARWVALRLGTTVRTWGEERPVSRVAVVGGSGGGEWSGALAARADVLVTGEVRHDVGLDASEAGLAVIEAGHYSTEAPGVEALFTALASEAPGIAWSVFSPADGRGGRPSRHGE